MLTLAVPLLPIVAPPPTTVALKVPCATLTVVLTASVAPTCEVSVASLTVIRLLLPLLNTSVPSSSTLCAAGTVLPGASLSAVIALDSVTVASEIAVVPPWTETLTPVVPSPGVALESIRRTLKSVVAPL